MQVLCIISGAVPIYQVLCTTSLLLHTRAYWGVHLSLHYIGCYDTNCNNLKLPILNNIYLELCFCLDSRPSSMHIDLHHRSHNTCVLNPLRPLCYAHGHIFQNKPHILWTIPMNYSYIIYINRNNLSISQLGSRKMGKIQKNQNTELSGHLLKLTYIITYHVKH